MFACCCCCTLARRTARIDERSPPIVVVVAVGVVVVVVVSPSPLYDVCCDPRLPAATGCESEGIECLLCETTLSRLTAPPALEDWACTTVSAAPDTEVEEEVDGVGARVSQGATARE